MSVKYTTRLGYGFILTKTEYGWLSDEKFEEFIDHDLTHILDGYDPDSDAPYFFGLSVISLDPGQYCSIPNDRHFLYTHQEIIEMLQEFKKFFPDLKDHPRDYVISCID